MKPPLTKRPSEVGYWEPNEMTGSGGALRQKKLIGYLRWVINFGISEVKQYEETTLSCVIVEGSNKVHQGGNYQEFWKWWEGEVFLGHSLIIIKWTCIVFSRNLQFDTLSSLKISHKKVWQTSKVKTGEGVSNRWDHICKKRGYSKCVHVRTRGDAGRIEKSVIRSARTKSVAPNKCHGTLFVHWSEEVP